MMVLSIEELVATMIKIEKGSTEKDGCFSTQDIANAMGITQGAARKRVRIALEAGTMEYAGKRTGVGIDGRKSHISVYRLVKVKAKKGGKKK